MRELAYVGSGSLAWHETPEPGPVTRKDALVRPFAVGTCDLDLALLTGGHALPGPFAFGHEFVAEVVDIGSEVGTVEVGDVVAVPFQISCGECDHCRRGLTDSCLAVAPLAAYGLGPIGGLAWGGALADLVGVPYADAMLVPVPPDVDPVLVASLSDNLPDAYRTVAAVQPGQDVLVVGGGSIGVAAVGLATALGASVRYVDRDATRCRIAEHYGAQVTQGPLVAPVAAADLVVHTSARPAQLRQALLSVRPGGELVDTGIYWGESTPMPLFEMYTTGVRFTTGRAPARALMPAVLELVRAGRFDPAPLLTVRADWDDAVDALRERTVKTVVSRPRAGSAPPALRR